MAAVNKYRALGLDVNKRATDDDGTAGASFCPWCSQNVRGGFSLCFAHFVICPACLGIIEEDSDRWEVDDCFKCRAKGVRAYGSITEGGTFHICTKCITWANQVLTVTNFSQQNQQQKMTTVREVLAASKADGEKLILPGATAGKSSTGHNLPPDLFERVQEILVRCGARWAKTGKPKHFTFHDVKLDAQDVRDRLVAGPIDPISTLPEALAACKSAGTFIIFPVVPFSPLQTDGNVEQQLQDLIDQEGGARVDGFPATFNFPFKTWALLEKWRAAFPWTMPEEARMAPENKKETPLAKGIAALLGKTTGGLHDLKKQAEFLRDKNSMDLATQEDMAPVSPQTAAPGDAPAEDDDYDELEDMGPVAEEVNGFQFNQEGNCMNPETVLEHNGKTARYTLEIAQHRNGWSYGYKTSLNDKGAVSASGISSKYNEDYPTREQAILYGCSRLLDVMKGYKKADKDMQPIHDKKYEVQEDVDNQLLAAQAEGRLNRNGQRNPVVISVMDPAEIPQMLPVNSITPDPGQPRKTYEEAYLQELTASVKKDGVLQAILVRPDGDGKYIIVFGHCRHIAAGRAGLQVMPAYVRDMPTEQARDLQLVENLQRQNMNPMEEAQAFRDLLLKTEVISGDNDRVEDVASRVGKTPYYVRQRLQLNLLVEQWQETLRTGLLRVVDALVVSTMPEQRQTQLYKRYEHKLKAGKRITINRDDIEEDRRLLDAPFDLLDATLNKKMGACSSCKYNTSCASLFPEDAENPICKAPDCYASKLSVHLQRELDRIKKQDDDGEAAPLVVLTRYSYTDNAAAEKAKAMGLKVLKYDRFNEVDQGKVSRDKITKGLETGKYKKALDIHTDSKSVGKIIIVEPHKDPAPAAQVKEKVKEGTAAAEDLQAEITRITLAETRKQQLDRIKTQGRVQEALKTHDLFMVNGIAPLNRIEAVAAIMVLWNDANLTDKIKKDYLGTNKGYGYHWHADMPLFEALKALDDQKREELLRICTRRSILFKLYQPNLAGEPDPEMKGDAAAIRAVAEEYLPEEVKIFNLEEQDGAKKRRSNVDKRLADLKEKQKELKPTTKKTRK